MTAAVATRGREQMRRVRAGPLFFLLPALIPVVLFSVLPLIQGIYLGFTDAKAGLNVDLAPTFLDNYTRLLGNDLFWQSFQIGVIWAFTTTFLQYILGLGLAILLEQRLHLLWLARTLALVPWAIPPVIVAIMCWLTTHPLANDTTPVIRVKTARPFSIGCRRPSLFSVTCGTCGRGRVPAACGMTATPS